MGDSLLFVTQVAPYADGPAGVHGVLEQAAVGVAQIAEMQGLEPHRVDDVRMLPTRASASAGARVVHHRRDAVERPQRALILDRVRAGALSVLAIHSATDSCYGWDEYGTLVGARFDGHPWTQTFTADVLDPSHPSCAHLGDAWQWHDEVYQFRDLRPDAQVLLRVRDGELDLDVPGRAPAVVRLPARVVLRRRRGPRVLDQPRPLPEVRGRARSTCATSPAASSGRWARLSEPSHAGATPCSWSQWSKVSTFCVSSKSSCRVIRPERATA